VNESPRPAPDSNRVARMVVSATVWRVIDAAVIDPVSVLAASRTLSVHVPVVVDRPANAGVIRVFAPPDGSPPGVEAR